MNKCWRSRGIANSTAERAEAAKIGKTDEGGVGRVKHVGSHASGGGTHGKIAAFLAAREIKRNGNARLSCITDAALTNWSSSLASTIVTPSRIACPSRIDPDQELADLTRKGGTTG